MTMTRTSGASPRRSSSAAMAAQPLLSKAFTGGWSKTISAMPLSRLTLNGVAMAFSPSGCTAAQLGEPLLGLLHDGFDEFGAARQAVDAGGDLAGGQHTLGRLAFDHGLLD